MVGDESCNQGILLCLRFNSVFPLSVKELGLIGEGSICFCIVWSIEDTILNTWDDPYHLFQTWITSAEKRMGRGEMWNIGWKCEKGNPGVEKQREWPFGSLSLWRVFRFFLTTLGSISQSSRVCIYVYVLYFLDPNDLTRVVGSIYSLFAVLYLFSRFILLSTKCVRI